MNHQAAGIPAASPEPEKPQKQAVAIGEAGLGRGWKNDGHHIEFGIYGLWDFTIRIPFNQRDFKDD